MTDGKNSPFPPPTHAAEPRPAAKGVNASGILPKFAEQVKSKILPILCRILPRIRF
jgi:hypothetical protein